MTNRIDLGSGFWYSFFVWDPDRELNPRWPESQYPRIDPAGVTLWRLEDRQPDQVIDDEAPEGKIWVGVAGCWFRSAALDRLDAESGNQTVAWELVALDPLHIEPSIQMYDRNHEPSWHGFIRDGKWVPA